MLTWQSSRTALAICCLTIRCDDGDGASRQREGWRQRTGGLPRRGRRCDGAWAPGRRMGAWLALAVPTGMRTIILGAWGCGVLGTARKALAQHTFWQSPASALRAARLAALDNPQHASATLRSRSTMPATDSRGCAPSWPPSKEELVPVHTHSAPQP